MYVLIYIYILMYLYAYIFFCFLVYLCLRILYTAFLYISVYIRLCFIKKTKHIDLSINSCIVCMYAVYVNAFV